MVVSSRLIIKELQLPPIRCIQPNNARSGEDVIRIYSNICTTRYIASNTGRHASNTLHIYIYVVSWPSYLPLFRPPPHPLRHHRHCHTTNRNVDYTRTLCPTHRPTHDSPILPWHTSWWRCSPSPAFSTILTPPPAVIMAEILVSRRRWRSF